jgi:hypothetical protein
VKFLGWLFFISSPLLQKQWGDWGRGVFSYKNCPKPHATAPLKHQHTENPRLKPGGFMKKVVSKKWLSFLSLKGYLNLI